MIGVEQDILDNTIITTLKIIHIKIDQTDPMENMAEAGAQTGLTVVNRDQLFALVSTCGVSCLHFINPRLALESSLFVLMS